VKKIIKNEIVYASSPYKVSISLTTYLDWKNIEESMN